MELKPSEPPGHARRKLRGLVSELARLRAEGYTIRVIRLTLEEAGVKVGWATVQRELARLRRNRHGSTAAGGKGAASADASKAGPRASCAAVDVDRYFDQHNTNPLFKQKGKKT